jgi:Ca-activated chloride channel homolog
VGFLVSFASLSALLWLLPLGGLIILLYLLKMRRKDLKVPASFLWPPMTYEVRANALIQRLRFSWLLILQLLALCLIVVALARPQMRQAGLGGEMTIIVIDTSASMSTREAGGTRFDEALRTAAGVIDNVRAEDRVSLIEAGPTPRVVFPLSNDQARMRAALASVEPTDAASEVGEALRLAASLASRHEAARIVLLSDGVFPEVRNFTPGRAKVEFVRMGKGRENTAIQALGVATTGEGRQLYYSLHNHGLQPSEGTLNLFIDGQLYNSIKVQVPPGSAVGDTLGLPESGRVIEARLDNNDLLSADNYAVAIADAGATVRALLVGGGNLFLERALSLDPRITLERASQLPPSEKAGSPGLPSYDLIVFDGVQEQPVKAKGVLTLGVAGPNSPVTASGSGDPGPLASEQHDHPLLTGLSFEGVFIERAERVRPKPEGEVLVETRAGPLIVVSETAQRKIYVGFEPLKSDFPLQVAFPIFVANAIDFLAPGGAGAPLAVATGRPFSLPALTDGEAILKGPTGEHKVDPAGGSYVFRHATRVGAYEIGGTADRPQQVFAVLASENESNIAPSDVVLLGGEAVAAKGESVRLADYWRPLLLLGLLVLAFEWWYFARRS